MGIVKISDVMHANLRATSGALGRSINAQAEHWMRVGMLSELYPSLAYGEICRILIQADMQGAAPEGDGALQENDQHAGAEINATTNNARRHEAMGKAA
ncbi:ParD-like family protein [Robbsia sp. KACC 23696]|uniref:ParD-like family protein n=1 Tax=Robbsia sp. KACC 23696 TaxID=3149231 RepID=UPI00325B6C43